MLEAEVLTRGRVLDADKARASISASEDERESLTAKKRSETQIYTSEKEHYGTLFG